MERWLLAALHLTALVIGSAAIMARARAFASRLDAGGIRRVLAADSWWGFAAVLWIGTGLWRVLASTEKPTAYYLASHVFWLKMGLLAAILILEIWPMVTLIGWRARLSRSESIDPSRAPILARISLLQFALVIAMVFAAAALARGYAL